jgi:hypothetical protein
VNMASITGLDGIFYEQRRKRALFID